jgi:pantoate kinase
MMAKAFCPGHVTGFFEIHEGADVPSTGSRGAGMCLSLGASSRVKVSKAREQTIQVEIDGKRAAAPVTKAAARQLLGQERVRVGIETTLDLPPSQGFGMSAAGALSASLALASSLGLTREEAFWAAHHAEVKCKTGLGDVSAIHAGGVTIRKKAGLPPVGEVIRIDGVPEVVLAVVGRKLLTKSVLTNPKKRAMINRFGSRRVDALLKDPTLENLMELSASFAMETGLASMAIVRAIGAASKRGMASMSMLGSSVFAIGDTDGLKEVLSELGEVWVCRVDTEGARLLST